MRDLLIQPRGHEGAFDPDRDNAARAARLPILLLEATTRTLIPTPLGNAAAGERTRRVAVAVDVTPLPAPA